MENSSAYNDFVLSEHLFFSFILVFVLLFYIQITIFYFWENIAGLWFRFLLLNRSIKLNQTQVHLEKYKFLPISKNIYGMLYDDGVVWGIIQDKT